MDNFKTVEGEIREKDPLLRNQNEGVAEMRTSLLACSDNPAQAVRELTIKRIYHQLTRIVRYTELMDKIENKLYESIENTVLTQDTMDPTTWMVLISIQERLQDNMIKSHKLLEPYIGATPEMNIEGIETVATDAPPSLLDRTSRDNVRKAAQELLLMLDEDKTDD